jgi:hypothetical protein
MCKVYLVQFHLLYYMSSTIFQSFLCFIMLSAYVHMQHTSIFFCPQYSFFSTSTLLLVPLKTPPIKFTAYYFYDNQYNHNFRSRFHKWMRSCNIWPFELGISYSAWSSPVPFIFLQMTKLHFCSWITNIWIYCHICNHIYHTSWYTYSTYIHIYVYTYIHIFFIHWLLGTLAI